MNKSDLFELQQANAEQEYANENYLELKEKVTDLLPILTIEQMEELVSIIEVNLREAIDARVTNYAESLPF